MVRKQCDKKLHEAIDKHTTKEGKHKVKTYYKPATFLQSFEVQEDAIVTFLCHFTTIGNVWILMRHIINQ